MPNSYLDIFDAALKAYQTQAFRPGYTTGLFEAHSCSLYPHIKKLQLELRNTRNDAQAKSVLQKYFASSKTKFNNHSFSFYLLDHLIESDPKEWEQYYPTKKQLVFYTGICYRGMIIGRNTLNDIFVNGHESRESSQNVDDYTNHTSGCVGISTSKEKLIAGQYASKIVCSGACGFIVSGYLLKINYRGQGGIDISKTVEKRNSIGENLLNSINNKSEVNIIGKIAPEDIEGAWPVSSNGVGTFIRNPKYLVHRPLERATSLAKRLACSFEPSVDRENSLKRILAKPIRYFAEPHENIEYYTKSILSFGTYSFYQEYKKLIPKKEFSLLPFTLAALSFIGTAGLGFLVYKLLDTVYTQHNSMTPVFKNITHLN